MYNRRSNALQRPSNCTQDPNRTRRPRLVPNEALQHHYQTLEANVLHKVWGNELMTQPSGNTSTRYRYNRWDTTFQSIVYNNDSWSSSVDINDHVQLNVCALRSLQPWKYGQQNLLGSLLHHTNLLAMGLHEVDNIILTANRPLGYETIDRNVAVS